jgi:nonribosomal peptide synthetase MxcG
VPSVLDLVPTRRVPLRDVFRWAVDFGYPVRLLPVPDWVDAVRAAGTDDAGVLHFFDRPAATVPVPAPTDSDSGSVAWPQVDRAAIHRILALAVAVGLLPKPTATVHRSCPGCDGRPGEAIADAEFTIRSNQPCRCPKPALRPPGRPGI